MGSESEFKSNHNVTFSCKYLIVWCPKYGRKVLVDGVDQRLKEIIRQSAAEHQVEIIELEVMPDYVHLLCEIDPQYGVHKLVKLLKGRSSHLLRQEFSTLKTRLPTLWTNSYFVTTLGGAPLAMIKQYIENQKRV
jgi:putative transposase